MIDLYYAPTPNGWKVAIMLEECGFAYDARFLDKQYTVWGVVTEGMDNVDALPKGEPPRAPGKIVSMKVAADA